MNAIPPSHKLFAGIVVVVIAAVSVACDQKEDPKLAVKEGAIDLTQDQPKKSLLIANIGEGTLNWSISDVPEWVSVSNLEGALEPGPDQIEFSADLTYESGMHSTHVNVNSNGGSKSIYLTFNQPKKDFTILPGVGITDIYISDPYNQVKNEIGYPDTIFHYLREDPETFYLHVGYYESLGLFLVFLNYKKSVIDNTDRLVLIECVPPFPGKTEEGLGIGSSLEDIESLYGTAADTIHYEENDFFYDYYDYTSIGIGFYFYNGNFNITESIDIYTLGNAGINAKKMWSALRPQIPVD